MKPFWRQAVSAGPLLLSALLLVGGCRRQEVGQTNPAGGAAPRDDLGRTIALNATPRRVVIIGPGALETAFALGAGSQVVGRDQIGDFPPQVKNIPIAGDFRGPFPEKAAALRPDLVIVQGETYDAVRVEQWQRQIGAPVAALTTTRLAGVRSGILAIGHWLGHEAAAKQLAATLDPAAQAKPAASLAGFMEVQRSPLWSAGAGTLVGEVLEAGGVHNVAAAQGLNGYGPFGLETLLAHQPDAYVVTSRQSAVVVLRELRATPVLSKLKCVRDGKVIVVDGDLVLRPGPRLARGIQALRQQVQLLSAAPKK